MRTYGWRSWREATREAALGALFGILLTLFESGGTKELPDAPTFARNAVLGLFLMMMSRGLETALSWAIEQSRYPTTFRTLIYALGGWLGYVIGVVVVSGFTPDQEDFGEGRYHLYYSLAAAAVGAAAVGFILHHNRKRNDRLRASIERLKEHEFAEKELEIARSMQQRLLPPPRIERDGFRVTARTDAAHIVGGDFYDVLRLADGATAILAADVAGKGIAASLIMATCKAMIPFLAATGRATDVMTALNASLCAQLQRREFVAMVFVRYDPSDGSVEVVNAGMPEPLLISKDSIRPLTTQGDRLPLGAMKTARYEAATLTLAKGERLVLFSDGLAEALVDGVHLGYERVEQLARRAATVDALVDEVKATAKIDDDVTVVMLEALR